MLVHAENPFLNLGDLAVVRLKLGASNRTARGYI